MSAKPMHWFRWHHGTFADQKWRYVSAQSGQGIPVVIAIWAALCECASESDDRGDATSWNPAIIATTLGIEVSTVTAVTDAMQGVVLEQMRLTGWQKRQPKREDESTGRVQRYRALQDDGNAMKRNETQCNAEKRNETPEKRREEKKREDTTTARSEYALGFEALWKAYPSGERGTKTTAYRAYKARLVQGDTEAEMLAGAHRYATYCLQKRMTYIKHVSTFLGPDRHFSEPWDTGTPDISPHVSQEYNAAVEHALAHGPAWRQKLLGKA